MNFRMRGGVARPAALAVAALVAGLTLISTQRAMAAVAAANSTVVNIVVNAGTDSAPQTLPSAVGNPTILTLTNRTSNDGVRSIATMAVNWENTAPQSLVWTGTSRSGGLVSGQTGSGNVQMCGLGPAVTVLTDATGGSVNKFKIRNQSNQPVIINIHEVW